MKIRVIKHILAGNLPEGFLIEKYCDAIEKLYIDTILSEFPKADISVQFDIQNASGVRSETSVIINGSDDETAIEYRLKDELETLSNNWWNQHGSESENYN